MADQVELFLAFGYLHRFFGSGLIPMIRESMHEKGVLVCLEHTPFSRWKLHHGKELFRQHENRTDRPIHKLDVQHGSRVIKLKSKVNFLQRFSVSDLHMACFVTNKRVSIVHSRDSDNRNCVLFWREASRKDLKSDLLLRSHSPGQQVQPIQLQVLLHDYFVKPRPTEKTLIIV